MTDLLTSVMLSGLWPAVKNWFFGLSDQYGVDPLVFGSISIGAIPLFWLSVAWLVRNVRQGRALFFPVMATALCVLSAYIYLFIAGENLPPWVYALVIGLVGYSAYSTVHTVRKKSRASKPEDDPSASPSVASQRKETTAREKS